MKKELTSTIKESFIQFAGAVLQSRALVDVRDCIKPSARQIFYCMYTDKFIHSKPFQKTLKAIGSAFRLYIHGDSSAEGVIMRAGQPFAMRYPLVEVEGSYGTLLASGSWAAPRYTGSRLSQISECLFADLQKDTIKEWRDNYDNTEQYPAVLPSKGFYNLVNGSYGIGVGASSSIPQYNIKELNNALKTLLLNPDCSFDDIYCAPDFATGATITNAAEVKLSHEKGIGAACRIRSTVEWDNRDKCFIVSEIPYMVYTETICKELEDIINGEENPGIERFNDLTGKTPLIKIYLTKTANPEKVLRYLYKKTSLESFYGVNFTMLDNGRFPRLFTWREALQAHITHEKEVYRRGFEFDLNKIKARLHIIEGLLICAARIEEVVSVIKSSSSTADANINLQKNFLLDEAQAKAVLDMKLARIAKLEVNKLENEKKELENEQARIEKILNDENLFNQQLINGWDEVSRKFGDERRTKVINITEGEVETEVKKLQISITNQNGMYITETSSLYTQRRGGIGNKVKLEKGEYFIDTITANSNDTLLFFTDKGEYVSCKASNFELNQVIYFNSLYNEKIQLCVGVNKENEKQNIIFFTKNGLIKKSALSEYNTKRANGTKALTLTDDDEVRSILLINNEKVGILTEQGNFVIVETSDITPIGRIAKGIKGIKLNEGDSVVKAKIVKNVAREVVSITGLGYIKRSPIDEYSVQNKNTKGVKIQKINSDDWMADFLPIRDLKEIIVNATSSSIKLSMNEIPLLGKNTQGVRAIKLKEKDNVISLG